MVKLGNRCVIALKINNAYAAPATVSSEKFMQFATEPVCLFKYTWEGAKILACSHAHKPGDRPRNYSLNFKAR